MDPSYIVVHTAAYDGENDSLEDIIRWHKERGFRTIGYHYYIRKDGTIGKGRKENEVGAHCRASDMNYKSIGICFEGHHDHEEWTQSQKSSFSALVRRLMEKYDIPKENIIGHREAYNQQPPPKTCPGKKIDMNLVREKYGSEIKKVEPAPLEEHLDDQRIDIDELAKGYNIE